MDRLSVPTEREVSNGGTCGNRAVPGVPRHSDLEGSYLYTSSPPFPLPRGKVARGVFLHFMELERQCREEGRVRTADMIALELDAASRCVPGKTWCRSELCTRCQLHLSHDGIDRLDALMRGAETRGTSCVLVTLTAPVEVLQGGYHASVALWDAVESLRSAVATLRRSAAWKRAVVGGALGIHVEKCTLARVSVSDIVTPMFGAECRVPQRRTGFNVHVHLVLELADAAFGAVDLRSRWLTSVAFGKVDVRPITAFREARPRRGGRRQKALAVYLAKRPRASWAGLDSKGQRVSAGYTAADVEERFPVRGRMVETFGTWHAASGSPKKRRISMDRYGAAAWRRAFPGTGARS